MAHEDRLKPVLQHEPTWLARNVQKVNGLEKSTFEAKVSEESDSAGITERVVSEAH
jgi:hypothetical protein